MKNYSKKYFMLAALGLMAAPALAQETYQDTKLAENQLTGTARYVGMGGAMEALGADISTISSNPAGIGLFHKGQISVSAGVIAQGGADTKYSFDGMTMTLDKAKQSHPTFDQMGIVWCPSANRGKTYFNVGFNYHKSADFGQILSAANSLGNASQNKITAAKYPSVLEISKDNKDVADALWTAVDAGYETAFGKSEDGSQMNYLNANSFLYGQYQHGYIGEYDFNISGGVNNRFWWGLTVGLHDVHYNSNSLYSESLENNGAVRTAEQVKIKGTGFDVKGGIIFRPVADSPFRIGAYFNSPVFYDLTGYYDNDMQVMLTYGGDNPNIKPASADYDFRLNTAWKAGVSLGHTVGNYLALGATYEYAWYDHMDNRIKDGGYYDDWYGTYYETSRSDKNMNDNTRNTLKGVSTLKVGLEYKPITNLAVRLGYNYVSPMFDENGYRDQTIYSPGVAYATSTDYTNWKATNRFTCGVGYNYQNLFIDVAYQYTIQKGDFYPFMSYTDASDSKYDCIAPSTEVKYNRHQVMMTVGYKF